MKRRIFQGIEASRWEYDRRGGGTRWKGEARTEKERKARREDEDGETFMGRRVERIG